MAEGIDGAADLFRQEIAPGSDRPRDESGRFSGTSSRPEPLFEPRPLEGDEKTGDTRDAGEDPRLKAIERRVADGRAEEGDADELGRLSDDAARARNADGERQGDGDPKPDDKKPDGEGEADEDDAEDADAARWALTHDGKPVDKIEIDIGGETKQVSLKEVIKGYAEQEKITAVARNVEHYARTFEQQSAAVAQEIGQTRQAYQQRLEYIGRVMADLYPKELNWEAEYSADPRAAHDKEKVYQHVRGRMTAIAQEMQNEQALANQQYQAQAQHAAQQEAAYADWGKQEFVRRTGLPNDSTLQNEYQQMRKHALEVYGFNEQEVGTIFDPRMLQVLHDASKWRRETASKPRPVSHDRGRTMTPGASRPLAASGARRGIDDALKNQARTGGSIDATAAVFEKLLR
jgi:hypothetical protein